MMHADRKPRVPAVAWGAAAAALLTAAVVVVGVRSSTPRTAVYALEFVAGASLAWSAKSVLDSLGHTKEAEARRRMAEERLGVARDLHDSVAHAMATITVQAGTAAQVATQRPEVVRDALAVIQQASGDVVDELAAMLTLLRDDRAGDRGPGIEQIPHLLEGTGKAGLLVSLTMDGPVAEVPDPVGAAAYRIVQESLTNVIRHAGATAAAVTVRSGRNHQLAVEVRDNGAGSAGESERTGIRGMRERAEATGGRLETGPGRVGGFVVRAVWSPPLEPRRRTPA